MKHLVFFDGECGLCDLSVRHLLKIDKDRKLLFAPLQGQTAINDLSKQFPEALNEDSLVLLDLDNGSGQIYLRGKAILRILWHVGGVWAILGLLSFLPTFLADAVYRLVAKNRHRLFPKPTLPLESRFTEQELQERFLP